MKLNKQELVIGFLYHIIFLYWSLWVIPTAFVSSYLWALSGEGQSKIYRRLGCPLLLAIALFLELHNNALFIAVPIAFGFLSLGYGIPDSTDEGSWLGRFFLKLTGGNLSLTNILTRGLIYVGITLPFLWILLAN